MNTLRQEPHPEPSEKIHISRAEKFFLAGLAVGSLLISVGFAVGTTIWRYGFPATVVAFLLGLALATLSYAFLGGVRGNEFTVGGIKLAGTAAVVAAVIYFLPGPLSREMNDIQLIEKGRLAESLVKAAEERAAHANRGATFIDTGDRKRAPLTSGGRVELLDITSSRGEISRIKRLPDAERAFETLLAQSRVQAPAAGLAATPQQWSSWLNGLPENRRQRVERIAFAVLSVRSSDGLVANRTVFKGDEVPVLDRNKNAEAFLCINYVLNVVQTNTFEEEVVIFEDRKSPCSEARD